MPDNPTSTTKLSPQRAARRARARRREEKRWASKAGEVTVRFVDPSTLRVTEGSVGSSSQSAEGAAPESVGR